MQLGQKAATVLGIFLFSLPVGLGAQQRTGDTAGPTSTSTPPATGTTAGQSQAGVGVSIDAGKAAKALIGILGKKKKKKAAEEAAATTPASPALVKPTVEATNAAPATTVTTSRSTGTQTISSKPKNVSTASLRSPAKPAPAIAKAAPTPKQLVSKPRSALPIATAKRPVKAAKIPAVAAAAVASPALATQMPATAAPQVAPPANPVIQQPIVAEVSTPAETAIEKASSQTSALSISEDGTNWGIWAALLAAMAALFASAKTILWPAAKLDCNIEEGNTKITAMSEAFINAPAFNLDVDIGIGPTKFPNGLKLAN